LPDTLSCANATVAPSKNVSNSVVSFTAYSPFRSYAALSRCSFSSAFFAWATTSANDSG
jgi:hypothetical protein